MKVIVYMLLTLGVTNALTSTSEVVGVESYAAADTFILDLLKRKLGLSNSAFKTLFRIQNGAFELLSSMRRPLTKEKKDKLLEMLDVASKANNTEKVNELLGKILFTMQSTYTKAEIKVIVDKYGPSLISGSEPAKDEMFCDESGHSRTLEDPFAQINKYLCRIETGSTLLFAIDTTGSMSKEIIEAKLIATDIINKVEHKRVNYILSPFNDPTVEPITRRSVIEKAKIIDDINSLRATGGGDCPELAIAGITNALDADPYPGSSMFVFTDAAPKDADDYNVSIAINAAKYSTVKISFFLAKSMCGNKDEIAKYRVIADGTTGELFTMNLPSGKRRKRMAASSKYTTFVSSSLRGTSLIKSKTSSTTTTSGNFHSVHVDVDDQLDYLNIVVTFTKTVMVTLLDPKNITQIQSLSTEDSIIYEIEKPVTGRWTFNVFGESNTYNYKISVAFKEPIAFDLRYFYQESKNKYIMIQKPLAGEHQKLMINMVGSDKIAASSLTASLVDLEGKQLQMLAIKNVGIKDNLKLTATFVPPNVPFRVSLKGRTKTGYRFERATEQVSIPAKIIFKTASAGDEFSVKIGSIKNRIMNILFIKNGESKSVNAKAKAKYGQITKGNDQTRTMIRRGFFFLDYEAPTDVKLRGKSDHITIQASFNGTAITTHRVSILLL